MHNLINVLFAVNRTYFPEDKKLSDAIDHLDRVPDRFVLRVQRLLFPSQQQSVQLLKQQQLDLQKLLAEVAELASD